MMLAMDEAIGRVRKKLADAGLEKNTLVAFISDNGGPTMPGTTMNGSRNEPLRGSKRTTLEGGIRVPFVVAWPGRVKPGVYRPARDPARPDRDGAGRRGRRRVRFVLSESNPIGLQLVVADRAAACRYGTATWFLKYNAALTTPRAKAVR